MTRRMARRAAFTLIELLVVIAIISLLLSILLPSLGCARRTGQRVACMANLKEISKGMNEYGTDNNGAIVGSPTTSGAYLVGKSIAYGPAVQVWDFMGPMAQIWNMGFIQPGENDPAGWVRRFDEIRTANVFRCPSNKFIAGRFDGPPQATAGWMVSYNTSRYQLMRDGPTTDLPASVVGMTYYPPNLHEEALPTSWKPNIDRMGSTSNKVFCADGARYADVETVPDFDLACSALWGGTFSDSSPYKGGGSGTRSRSWDRTRAPGNGFSGSTDGRVYSYRHTSCSDPPAGAKADMFKMNLAFYDGHVETQGDLQSSNPQQWLPRDSTLTIGGTINADTVQRFSLSGTIHIGG